MTEIKYYSYDNDCGYEEHDDEKKAADTAQESLDLRDEFSEDDEIEYGVMIPLGRLVETNRRDTPEDEDEDKYWTVNGWTYSAHHEIATVTTLNHHLANEFVRLRAEIERLRSELSAITTNLDSMPEGVDVTLYRSFRWEKNADGKMVVTETKFCARATAYGCGGIPASQTIEADTAAECLLKLARLLP